jgi:chromate transporter
VDLLGFKAKEHWPNEVAVKDAHTKSVAVQPPPQKEKQRDTSAAPRPPAFTEAFRFWLKLGFISFGGPAGQIAIMHSELVERRKWIDENRFLHALNYCMLLPGPEATQLATYIGWLLHRTWGGVVAGTLFVLPSMFILWLLSFAYVKFGNVAWVASIFYGLKPAVLAIVAAAVIRIGSKALKNEVMWTLAALAFIAIYFFRVPFPVIVISAGVIGWLGGRVWAQKFLVIGHKAADGAGPLEHTKPSLARAGKVLAVCLTLWFAPLLLAGGLLGWQHTIVREGLFFSKAAMVTFGGAYAVLPYVSQQAVEQYQWLSAPQMLDGLGLAETTPGPLIMVLQFVGFLGAWHQPGTLNPLLAGTLGALMTTWTTFVPCFLWIFLGAPHIEQLHGNRTLTTALSAVTAAVVGVILNLAIWFGVHVLVPGPRQVDWFAVGLFAVMFGGLVKWNWHVVPVVVASGALGLLYNLLR